MVFHFQDDCYVVGRFVWLSSFAANKLPIQRRSVAVDSCFMYCHKPHEKIFFITRKLFQTPFWTMSMFLFLVNNNNSNALSLCILSTFFPFSWEYQKKRHWNSKILVSNDRNVNKFWHVNKIVWVCYKSPIYVSVSRLFEPRGYFLYHIYIYMRCIVEII